MDAEFLRGGEAVAAGVLQGFPDGLSFDEISGPAHVGAAWDTIRNAGHLASAAPVRQCGHVPARPGQLCRQVFDTDGPAAAEDESPFNDVLQFAYVSRPVVGHEQRQGLDVDAGYRLAVQTVEPGDELVGNQRDVFLAAAQRRQFDADDIHTVVEVFAKDLLPNQRAEVLVGGDHHPGIGRLRTG